MRAVIQRVSEASVKISGEIKSSIGKGLLVLLGIEEADNDIDIEWLCGKISRLRIFPDQNDVMNLSVMDINGDVLLISQFTLFASTKKGNRPGYIKAARPRLQYRCTKNLSCRLKRKPAGKYLQVNSAPT